MIGDGSSIDAIARRDPTATVDRYYERIREVEPDVRAFVEKPDGDRLHRAAEACSERFADGPPSLHGVPVGVKDVFRTDEFPTRAGSDLPPETFDGPEAEAVSRLLSAGAIVLGKTVTTEFAYFEPGPTRNPHDLGHTPGGSSSGSAAAVAAGMCPLAIGTQTVGSVIRPAAFCGIVGFKPSFGRIPTDGIIPFSRSADHVGTFTRSVEDAAVAASVLCDEWDDIDEPDRPVLGVPDGPYLEQADPTGREQFEAGIETLSAAGYDVRRRTVLEDIERVNDRHREMIAAELALAHDAWFDRHGDLYSDTTADLIHDGFAVRVGTLVDARAGRKRVRNRLHRLMDEHGIDCWISPASPGPAPEGIDDTGDPAMNLPWTHAGLPTVTVPAGTVDGLPVGLQCVARFGADESLCRWASELAADLDGDP